MPRIFEDIYAYVHPQDANCNVFVFKDGIDLDFIDTGVTLCGINRWLWKQIRKDGLEPTNIRNIFHCHIHPDHYQADTFFQQKAIKNHGQVKVYYPKQDQYRLSASYGVIRQNINEVEKTLGANPIDRMPFSPFFMKSFAEPLFKCPIPNNLVPYHHKEKLQIGNRIAEVIHTGGHTEGHSYFHFSDENILVNSDSGVINEYLGDFEKVVHAIKLIEDMQPDNLLGGHNALFLGTKNAAKDISSWGRRLSNVIRPVLLQLIPGKQINISEVGWRRVGVLHRLGIVEIWAQMTPYAFAKYLQNQGFGTLFSQGQSIIFKVTENRNYIDDLADLRTLAKNFKEPFHRVVVKKNEIKKSMKNVN